ncbi:MAG: DUF3791 domain-containing protein [Chitinispirillia bacterium]|nr:DUF3791 domain-containing protein [Chitinispirillia bacterium]
MNNIPKPEGKIWFLASCVELYKDQKGMTGGETWKYLRQTGAAAFITDCWEGLHTTGPEYIVDSIDEYIRNNDARSGPSTHCYLL